MSSTYTETIQERLSGNQDSVAIKTATRTPSQPGVLLRTSSFYRLKQFPAYFCQRSTGDLVQRLFESRTKFSKTVAHHYKELHTLVLTLAVYLAVVILSVQLITFASLLAGSVIPLGLSFLLSCTVIISGLAIQLTFTVLPKIEKTHKCRQRSHSLTPH